MGMYMGIVGGDIGFFPLGSQGSQIEGGSGGTLVKGLKPNWGVGVVSVHDKDSELVPHAHGCGPRGMWRQSQLWVPERTGRGNEEGFCEGMGWGFRRGLVKNIHVSSRKSEMSSSYCLGVRILHFAVAAADEGKQELRKGSSGRGVTGDEAVQSRRRVYARRRMADSNPPDPHKCSP
eukprot:1145968-Pelagomonas_calceolata.AAC.1